jgi:hypothetical protein
MKREDVIALCHYYRGEEMNQCPYTDSIKAQLWTAEMMACTYLIEMIGDNNPKDDLHNVVFAYVSKWNPYTFRDTLDEYIKVAHPKQSTIDTYYN